jgi:hypothetical protein
MAGYSGTSFNPNCGCYLIYGSDNSTWPSPSEIAEPTVPTEPTVTTVPTVNPFKEWSNRKLNWAIVANRIRVAHGFEAHPYSDVEQEFHRRLEEQNWARYHWYYFHDDDDDDDYYFQDDKFLRDYA